MSFRPRLMRLAVAAVLAGSLSSSAMAAERDVGIHWQPGEMVMAPDGRFVYAAGYTLQTFARDPESGRLTSAYWGETAGRSLAISPDGRFLYSDHRSGVPFPKAGILEYSIDRASGAPTFERGQLHAGQNGPKLWALASLRVSPDGRQLYASQQIGPRLHVFDIDQVDGSLRLRQTLDADAIGQGAYGTVLIPPDGRNVYVGSNAFARDLTTGALTPLKPPDVDRGGWTAAAPDGSRVYRAYSKHLSTYVRDPDTGALTLSSMTDLDEVGCEDYCLGVPLSVSPDAGAVFVSEAMNDPALAQANVTPDGTVFGAAHGSAEGLEHATGMAWSPDGRLAYVAAKLVIGPTEAPSRYGAIATYSWDPTTRSLAFKEVALAVNLWNDCSVLPPYIEVGDGEEYTNDRDVDVYVVQPCWAASLRLTQDPSRLDDGPATRIDRNVYEHHYRWRLDGDGKQRLYVRFTGDDLKDPRTLHDDIIVDRVRPAVTTALLTESEGHTYVVIEARDARSGVGGVQMTHDKRQPGKLRKFRRRFRVGREPGRLYLRVKDRAGNASRWRQVGRG